MRHYRDFVIRIGTLSSSGQRYKVRVDGPVPGDLPSFEGETRDYNPNIFRDAAGNNLLTELSRRKLSREQIIQLGTILADLLLPGSIRRSLVESVRITREREQNLRLRLLAEAPEFQILPWEFLYLPLEGTGGAGDTGFLALNPDLSIVRHDPRDAPEPRLAPHDNYRFLVALAEPEDQNPLNVAHDREAIARLLESEQAIGTVTPVWVEQATRRRLEEELRRSADLFHFGGHGYFDHRTRHGSLILEQEQERRTDVYQSRFLARRLREAGVRLAVLGACNSGQRAAEQVWDGVATALIQQGVAAVVASQFSIKDQNVRPLVERFYPLVLSSHTVDEAVAEARWAIYERAGLENRDWGSLVLHMQAHSGILFPAPETRIADGTGGSSNTVGPVAPREAPTALQILLVGCDAHLEEVPPRLHQGENYYYHGPFGVGKTTLSKALFLRAVRQKEAFTDGYMWLDVGKMSVERVLEHIASRFRDDSVAQAQGRTEKINALRSLLAARPRVLIGLDDVQDREVARAVLEAAGNCTVLVNGGRALADRELAEEKALAPLEPELALELFLQEAHIDGETLSTRDRRRVEEICERLGHLPLAIHLAASRYAETRRLDQLYERVMTNPALVATEHAAVANAFRAAFEPVKPHKAARRLLARLTAFPARDADESALQASMNALRYFQARDKLLALGLLTISAPGRLALHPLLGALAEMELEGEQLTEEKAMVDDWLLAYAQRHSYDYDILAGEHHNLVGLLDRLQEETAYTFFDLLHSLVPYFRVRGHWTEAREQLDRALTLAHQRQDPLVEAQVRLDRAVIVLLQGDDELAAADLEAAAAAFRDEGLLAEAGKAAYHLARIAASTAEWQEAEAGYREAIRLLEWGEPSRELIGAHANLGKLLDVRGEHDEAQEKVQRALALAESLDDREWLATLYNILGKFSRQAGDPDTAVEYFRQALALAQAIGAPRVQAVAETQLGHTLAYQDRFDEAAPHYEQAVALFQKLQDPAGEAWATHDLGNVALAEKEFDEARDHYEAALAINERIGKEVNAMQNRYQLALVAQRQDRLDVAREWYREVLAQAQALRHQRLATAAAHQLARVAWTAKDLETADEYEGMALTYAGATADPQQIATVLHTRGLIRRDRGDIPAARADLRRALELYRELNAERAARVEATLANLDEEK